MSTARINYIRIPHVHTSDHEYATMEAHYNRSYYARTLPPVPKGCPTPFGVAGKKCLVWYEHMPVDSVHQRAVDTVHQRGTSACC